MERLDANDLDSGPSCRNEGIDGGHAIIVIDIQSRVNICRVTGLTERFGMHFVFVFFCNGLE